MIPDFSRNHYKINNNCENGTMMGRFSEANLYLNYKIKIILIYYQG